MWFAKILKALAIVPSLLVGIEHLFGPKTGGQKKSYALDAIGSLLGIADAIAGKDIVDQQKFQEGLSKAIDAVIQMLNASVWHKAA